MRTGPVPEAGAGGKVAASTSDAAVFIASTLPATHRRCILIYRELGISAASPRDIGFSDVEIHAGCNRGVSGFQWDTRDGADVVVAAVA
jgi:hypothetical protein